MTISSEDQRTFERVLEHLTEGYFFVNGVMTHEVYTSHRFDCPVDEKDFAPERLNVIRAAANLQTVLRERQEKADEDVKQRKIKQFRERAAKEGLNLDTIDNWAIAYLLELR